MMIRETRGGQAKPMSKCVEWMFILRAAKRSQPPGVVGAGGWEKQKIKQDRSPVHAFAV